MFSRGHGKSHGHKPKKEANTKKHHIRSWMHKRKKKNDNLFAVMMSSGDTTPQAQASISSTGFDMVDDTRLDKKDQTIIGLTSMKPAKSAEVAVTDPEAIEEVVSIRETQFTSKTKPKMENGIDIEKDKEPRQQIEDDCLINCIYYTQECCSCTIS